MTMHTRLMNFQTKQPNGFTLIEIMIAITLGLVLTGGLIQVYASSKKSSRIQNQLSNLQSNQRFVLNFLNRDIRMAGFVDTRKIRAIQPVPKFGPETTNGKETGGVIESDTISVIYESPQDCLGNVATGKSYNTVLVPDETTQTPTLTAIPTTTNIYTVSNQTLLCQGGADSIPQPIADGVVNMQVMYGLDTIGKNGDINGVGGRDGVADIYVNSGNVGNSDIVSVRIALLFKTDEFVKRKPETMSFNLLDASPINVTNSLHRYEVATTTISVRNKPL